ncbi:glycosyltransferase [Cytobacillus oceanisediminis]|uniref:glycosyltransferase n=1 Tax=Cytobacillus oceanisediminis TaxID=665099 RepID=UPI001CCA6E95|nr:glycosyltransferase [Cytobacillus oceanisediminis]MBZ9537143.1 glycosyltransferase [Cytobacillus oceanisediminis]
MKIKVLHVCEYTKGGIATYLGEVLNYQKSNKMITNVSIILSDYQINKEEYTKVKSYFYHYVRSPRYFVNAIKEINKAIIRESPDIIHLHSTFAGLFARVLFLFRKKRPKIVYCSHGWAFTMDIPLWKKQIYAVIERILAVKTDLIINISKSELEISRKFKLPKEKSIVIYNGISKENKLIAEKSTLEDKIDRSKINLLFIGRFDKQKGLDFLLDVFKVEGFSNIRLYLVGDNVLNSSKLDLSGNIFSLGWVDNKFINNYYEMFDAVIIPSRWEGFGLVAIEAMRNKKALLVSDRGALPEIVKNEVNGYVFSINDQTELTHVLSNLNKNDLHAMGEKGYEMFLKDFTSEKMNKEIIKQYYRILN